jgi:hypothetical protein
MPVKLDGGFRRWRSAFTWEDGRLVTTAKYFECHNEDAFKRMHGKEPRTGNRSGHQEAAAGFHVIMDADEALEEMLKGAVCCCAVLLQFIVLPTGR